MASNKIFNYKEHEIFVGKIFLDANGFEWRIIWCGAKLVKAEFVKNTKETTYTAHWCFIENMLSGYLSNRILKFDLF